MKMPFNMIERLIYPGDYMVKEEVLDYVINYTLLHLGVYLHNHLVYV